MGNAGSSSVNFASHDLCLGEPCPGRSYLPLEEIPPQTPSAPAERCPQALDPEPPQAPARSSGQPSPRSLSSPGERVLSVRSLGLPLALPRCPDLLSPPDSPASLLYVVTCPLPGMTGSPRVIRGPRPDFLPREPLEFLLTFPKSSFLAAPSPPSYPFPGTPCEGKAESSEHRLSPRLFLHVPFRALQPPQTLLSLSYSVRCWDPRCPHCTRLSLISLRGSWEGERWLGWSCYKYLGTYLPFVKKKAVTSCEK